MRSISFGKARFDFVDLTIEGPNAFNINPDKMRPILDRYNMIVTGHTDPCLPWAYPIEEVRKACLRELERCAGIFSALGAKIMNIHPCYFCPPAMKPALVDLNIEALKPIVEMAASYGLTLVLENFKAPFDRVATFNSMLAEVPGLKVHLDFGHANMGADNHEVFCRQAGKTHPACSFFRQPIHRRSPHAPGSRQYQLEKCGEFTEDHRLRRNHHTRGVL